MLGASTTLIQLIPAINNSVRKKILHNIPCAPDLFKLTRVTSCYIYHRQCIQCDRAISRNILKTSIISCLFRRSSSVHNSNNFNLSSYIFSHMFIIILVYLCYIFSMVGQKGSLITVSPNRCYIFTLLYPHVESAVVSLVIISNCLLGLTDMLFYSAAEPQVQAGYRQSLSPAHR